MRTALVAAAVICTSGCGQESKGPAGPTPFDTGLYTLSGSVFDLGPQGPVPIRSRILFHFVRPGDTFTTTDELVADDGRFRVEHIPRGTRIKLRARVTIGEWRNQPCGVNHVMVADAVRDIEVVRSGMSGLTTGPPVLRGTVFEQTPSGAQPIPNADVSFVSGCAELHEVYARTDAEGRYAFCRVSAGPGCVFAAIERFGERWFEERRVPVTVVNDTVLDVQLQEGTPPGVYAFLDGFTRRGKFFSR